MATHHSAHPPYDTRPVGNDDVCSEEGSNDPANDAALLSLHKNPQQQQLWRELEEADAKERYEEEEQNDNDDTDSKCTTTLSDGRTVLDYNLYLANQRYYDDLKHVDYNYIQYKGNNDRGGLLVEQDKSLGKGGLCWDAAFILAEYMAQELAEYRTNKGSSPIKMIELGCGTGVCGLLLAYQLQKNTSPTRPSTSWSLDLTDLPALQPLLQRNLQRYHCQCDESIHADEDLHCMEGQINNNSRNNEQQRKGHNSNNRTHVQAFVLDWETVSQQQQQQQTYDVVLGADVVATLYNPTALVETICALCHSTSVVYLSGKERLSTLHRQFEQELRQQFASVEIMGNGSNDDQPLSHNRNPDVRVIVARNKKTTMRLTAAEIDWER